MAVDSNRTIYQRIRYGLTGLAVVFLVVLLGAAMRRVGHDSPAPPPAVATDPNEPLAEIGAAPGQGQSDDNSAGPAQGPKARTGKTPAR